MLLRVNEIMSPIQQPSMNMPSFGKYPNTYPAKKLQVPERISMFEIRFNGTPGENMMGTSIARRMKNIVHAPKSTIEAL